MKKLQIVIFGVLVIVFCSAQNADKDFPRYIDGEIKNVVICDSAFMDEVLKFVSDDSIIESLQSYFLPNLDFNFFFKSPNSIEVLTQNRNISANKYRGEIPVFKDLIDDSIREILDNDSNVQVILILKRYISCKYKTVYKDKTFYFDEPMHPNGKRLFKTTGKRVKIKEDIEKIINGWYQNIYIPLIYHNNHLYIEPDSLQWFIMTE